MIGVPEAHRHFGSTIGREVLDVLHTLGLSPEKIGYFTLDNAENNDTSMEVIGAELGFDGRLRRGRCIGHIINLSAKALLFGKNADAFEQQLSGAEALSDTEYARWRKKGPVGKLHNIVVDVKEMVADVWLSDYAHLEVRTSSSRGDDEPPAKRPRFFNPFEKNSCVPNSLPAHAAAIVGDEYQAWQTDRDASDSNPMSAKCEMLFSAAGKIVSGLYTNLDAEIIAICQVLRSWYRAGLIKDLDPLLKSHLESKHDAGCGTLSDGELALAETKWLLEGEDSASEVDDSSQQQQAKELVPTSESEAE
ncbi:restless-like transposase [Fusarium bulbicola]|nr:restless-like transposase [Fusarium bulbicola]